jgi:hypothetical protein
MKFFKYILLACVLAVTFSCTDEDLFKNEVHFRLENGGFVRFEGAFKALIGADSPGAWSYDELVQDPNGNLSSYDVYVIGATDTSLVISHPNPTGSFALGLTSANVSAALGVDPSALEFGQALRFLATATRNDGVIFDSAPLKYDPATGETSGTTQENLLDASAYRSAMDFTLTIACPGSPNAATYLGTMNITASGWFVNGPVTVVAGSQPNQIVLKNVEGRADGRLRGSSADFTLTLNDDQTVSFERQEGWNDSGYNGQYGEYRMLPVSGGNFTFECSNNSIIVRMRPNVNAGNFGVNTMRLSK